MQQLQRPGGEPRAAVPVLFAVQSRIDVPALFAGGDALRQSASQCVPDVPAVAGFQLAGRQHLEQRNENGTRKARRPFESPALASRPSRVCVSACLTRRTHTGPPSSGRGVNYTIIERLEGGTR